MLILAGIRSYKGTQCRVAHSQNIFPNIRKRPQDIVPFKQQRLRGMAYELP